MPGFLQATVRSIGDGLESIQRHGPYGVRTMDCFTRRACAHQTLGCTPKAQASSVKLTKAMTVLLMMMRVTRPLSAP